MTEQDDDVEVQCIRRAEHGVHQRSADAAALLLWSDADRPETGRSPDVE